MATFAATNHSDVTFPPTQPAQAYSWYAVRVRSRFEFTAVRLLREKGIEQFLPSYRSRRCWSDRIKELELPLFPGYVFCRFDARSPLSVLTTPGVVDIVGAGRTPSPVSDDEINAIQDICCSGLPVEPWPYLKAGRHIRIERGPLTGIEGVVIETKGCWRLVASISILGRSVAAEVEREWIRPLPLP